MKYLVSGGFQECVGLVVQFKVTALTTCSWLGSLQNQPKYLDVSLYGPAIKWRLVLMKGCTDSFKRQTLGRFLLQGNGDMFYLPSTSFTMKTDHLIINAYHITSEFPALLAPQSRDILSYEKTGAE